MFGRKKRRRGAAEIETARAAAAGLLRRGRAAKEHVRPISGTKGARRAGKRRDDAVLAPLSIRHGELVPFDLAPGTLVTIIAPPRKPTVARRAGGALGRMGLRIARLGGLAAFATALILVLDAVFLRDARRPAHQPAPARESKGVRTED